MSDAQVRALCSSKHVRCPWDRHCPWFLLRVTKWSFILACFSDGYRTTAVHWQNGTETQGVKLRAREDYKDLLRKLSSLQAPPPQMWYEKWQRWMNKKRGRPATPEIGILSSMLRDLAVATSALLHLPSIGKVVVAAPLLEAITGENLNDAIEYAGMSHWLDEEIRWPKYFGEMRAAHASNGLAICHDWRNTYNCQDEVDEWPVDTVYSVRWDVIFPTSLPES